MSGNKIELTNSWGCSVKLDPTEIKSVEPLAPGVFAPTSNTLLKLHSGLMQAVQETKEEVDERLAACRRSSYG